MGTNPLSWSIVVSCKARNVIELCALANVNWSLKGITWSMMCITPIFVPLLFAQECTDKVHPLYLAHVTKLSFIHKVYQGASLMQACKKSILCIYTCHSRFSWHLLRELWWYVQSNWIFLILTTTVVLY